MDSVEVFDREVDKFEAGASKSMDNPKKPEKVEEKCSEKQQKRTREGKKVIGKLKKKIKEAIDIIYCLECARSRISETQYLACHGYVEEIEELEWELLLVLPKNLFIKKRRKQFDWLASMYLLCSNPDDEEERETYFDEMVELAM